MLDRADNFLVDYVAQPVADRLSGKVSISALSGCLFVGSAVMLLGKLHAKYTSGGLAPTDAIEGIGLAYAFWFWSIAESRSKENRGGVAPKERLTLSFMRKLCLVFSPFIVAGDLFIAILSKYELARIFMDLNLIMEIAGLYFLACRQNPPKQQRAEVHIGIFQPVRVR